LSLPSTAVGPLKVLTNPILMESAALAGFANARTVAPASQNAVLIFRSLNLLCRETIDCYAARQLTCPDRGASPLRCRASFLGCVLCARDHRSAASKNRRPRLRTFGSMQVLMYHNSYKALMARIIVLVAGGRDWPSCRPV